MLSKLKDQIAAFRAERPKTALAVAVAGGVALTSAALYFGHQNIFVHSELYCYALSRTFFEFSLHFNALRYGSVFRHQRISDIRPDDADPNLFAQISEDGKLVSFFDHPEHASSPIILSGIPRKPSDVQSLREAYGLHRITFYTLNLAFERRRSGMDAVLQQDDQLSIRLYPTIDFYTPSFVDLVRAVRSLRIREQEQLAVVHCKAGRGRSTAVVAAYILAEQPLLSVVEVEAFIRSKRPEIKLGKAKRAALTVFATRVREAGSFDLLFNSVLGQVEAREQQLESEIVAYAHH